MWPTIPPMNIRGPFEHIALPNYFVPLEQWFSATGWYMIVYLLSISTSLLSIYCWYFYQCRGHSCGTTALLLLPAGYWGSTNLLLPPGGRGIPPKHNVSPTLTCGKCLYNFLNEWHLLYLLKSRK